MRKKATILSWDSGAAGLVQPASRHMYLVFHKLPGSPDARRIVLARRHRRSVTGGVERVMRGITRIARGVAWLHTFMQGGGGIIARWDFCLLCLKSQPMTTHPPSAEAHRQRYVKSFSQVYVVLHYRSCNGAQRDSNASVMRIIVS